MPIPPAALLVVALLVQAGDPAASAPAPAPLRLAARSFVPAEGIDPALRARLEAATPAEPVPFLLQLRSPLEPAVRRELEARGVAFLTPLRERGWFASAASAAALDHPAVRAAAPFRPGDRVAASLRSGAGAVPAHARETDGRVRLAVVTFRDVPLDAALARLRAFDPFARATGPHVVALAVPFERIGEVEALPLVLWIEDGGRPLEIVNDRSRVATRAEEVQNFALGAPPVYDRSGAGVQVAVFDTGIDSAHGDFAGRILRAEEPWESGVPWHGTHVAGIVAGSGARSAANGGAPYQWRGMAPEAGLVSYIADIDANEYAEAINAYGADISTNSFVQAVECEYDAYAVNLDDFVRGELGVAPARPITIVFGSGNNGSFRQYGPLTGYYSVFTSAKNTISVGATNSDNDVLSYFSSMGPTFDGRIKPDVMAPGCSSSAGIYSTYWPGNGYAHACGTSMATPCASGLIALVMEEYAAAYGADIDAEPMRNSLVKAVLVNTAKDLVGANGTVNPDTGAPVSYFAGPDFATGFGLIDAREACDLVKEKRLREFTVPSTGSERTLKLDLAGSPAELRVTVAWDDLPGNPAEIGTAEKLVNDLDLTLVSPSGATALPFLLQPLPHEPYDGSLSGIDPIAPGDVVPATRGADHRNNVEQVVVAAPANGRWLLRVRGFDLASAQTVSIASSEPIPIFALSADCGAAPDPDGKLTIDAEFENLTNEAHAIRVAVNFVDCDGTRYDDARVFTKSVGAGKKPVRSIRTAVPAALASGCDLTMELEVTLVASGDVEALAACVFRK